MLSPVKLSFKNGEINTFPDKQKLRVYITTRLTLQESSSSWKDTEQKYDSIRKCKTRW